MKLDYDKLVADIDLEGLTLRKVTNKYIKEHFEVDMLRKVLAIGDGNKDNNEEELVQASQAFIPEIIDVKQVPLTDLLMSHEMSKTFWLGFIQNMIEGEFVKTVRDQRGQVLIQSYNKTKEPEVAVTAEPEMVDLTEKEVIDGLKLALKERIRNS